MEPESFSDDLVRCPWCFVLHSFYPSTPPAPGEVEKPDNLCEWCWDTANASSGEEPPAPISNIVLGMAQGPAAGRPPTPQVAISAGGPPYHVPCARCGDWTQVTPLLYHLLLGELHIGALCVGCTLVAEIEPEAWTNQDGSIGP